MEFETFLGELIDLVQGWLAAAHFRLSSTHETFEPSSRAFTFEVKGQKLLFRNMLEFLEGQRTAWLQGRFPAGDPYEHFQKALEAWQVADFIAAEGVVDPELAEGVRDVILMWTGQRSIPKDE